MQHCKFLCCFNTRFAGTFGVFPNVMVCRLPKALSLHVRSFSDGPAPTRPQPSLPSADPRQNEAFAFTSRPSSPEAALQRRPSARRSAQQSACAAFSESCMQHLRYEAEDPWLRGTYQLILWLACHAKMHPNALEISHLHWSRQLLEDCTQGGHSGEYQSELFCTHHIDWTAAETIIQAGPSWS